MIAIIDAGFLLNHDEFAGDGKVTTPDGSAKPGVDDHGTSVASIAAGVADFGKIIGVAPGAKLHLGSYNSMSSMRVATQEAMALGAIVQNNSWGYGLSATKADFDYVFGGASGKAYIGALQDFAKNGVIVFAASNDRSRTKIDLMAGLPSVVSGIKSSWITVVNAVPVFSGGGLQSASLISSGCLQAAKWCMAADGTVQAARASDVSSYELVSGSSFAAPQVSGAVALLAEAFPNLSAQEIRARLLASANNSFYKHSGYVEFAKGLKHGYNSKYGHGFLDLKAALLPIGGAFVPLAAGKVVPVNTPVVLSGGMVGDAVAKSLSTQNIIFVDGLGGGFDTSANMLSVQSLPSQDARVSLGRLMATNLNSSKKNPFDTNSIFSSLVVGREMEFEFASTNIAVLMPASGDDGDNFGFAISQSFDLGPSALSLGFSAMRESDGFVGMKSLLSGEHLSSYQGAATVKWEIPLIADQQISFSGSLGLAMPDGTVSGMSLSPVQYNSVRASYSARDVFGAGDRFSLSVGLPQVIGSGSAKFILPVSLSASGPQFSSVNVPLAPEGRQMDVSVSYGLPLTRSSEIIMTATHSLNAGNISGRTDSLAAVGWRFRF
ncbi:MAG: S8 family peptidase [Paracoccaceae bacterium]